MYFKPISDLVKVDPVKYSFYKGLDHYLCSSDGRLLNLKSNRTIKPSLTGQYPKYTIGKTIDGKRICKSIELHRLVALLFVEGYKEGLSVDHIIPFKFEHLFEENYYKNLRWVTHKENCNNPKTIAKRKNKKNKYELITTSPSGEQKVFFTIKSCADYIGVHQCSVSKCIDGIRKTTGNGYTVVAKILN